jgi:hypothetical protein
VASRLAIEQGAERLHGLVEALPALLEVQPNGCVITGGGTGPNSENQPSSGQDVKGGRRLGQCDWSTYKGQRYSGRQRQVAAMREHGRQRGGPIKPGAREHQMVIGRESCKPKSSRGLGNIQQLAKRKWFIREPDQRQMNA